MKLNTNKCRFIQNVERYFWRLMQFFGMARKSRDKRLLHLKHDKRYNQSIIIRCIFFSQKLINYRAILRKMLS